MSDDCDQRAQELIDDRQRKTFAWSLWQLWCRAVCFWFTLFFTQISEPQSMKQLDEWTQQRTVNIPTGDKRNQFLKSLHKVMRLEAHAIAQIMEIFFQLKSHPSPFFYHL